MGNAKPPAADGGELLMPSQVVRRFGVDPKTLARWTQAGKVNPITTPGGHRRFRASEVQRCIEEGGEEEQSQ